MAERKLGSLLRFAVALATFRMGANAFASEMAAPPILEGAKSASGWNYLGCSPPPFIKKIGPEAVSPELMQRLSSKYPMGSEPEVLWSDLKADGFSNFASCPEDHSIQHASFQRSGLTATIAWKVDTENRIEWTKGFVSFDGL